jgi:hypothetical protein
MLPELGDKNVNIRSIAEKALENEGLLSDLLDGLKYKEETFRYNCFKVLMLISKEHGEVLYPYWDYFVELLSSEHTYWEMSALQIIANLTELDVENRFEKIFDRYYSILNEEKTSIAAHVAVNSGKIAKAKPELRARITDRLLNIDKTHRGKQKDLIKGYAIEAFSQYFEEIQDKDKILEFVKGQLDSKSPKTRKAAEEFLSRWAQFRTK